MTTKLISLERVRAGEYRFGNYYVRRVVTKDIATDKIKTEWRVTYKGEHVCTKLTYRLARWWVTHDWKANKFDLSKESKV